MRLKLGLLMFGILFVFSLLTNFYVIGTLETDSMNKLERNLVQSYNIYQKTNRVTREERLDLIRKFAENKEIVDAMLLPTDTEEEREDRHYNLFNKLEVISQLKYLVDIFIVTDAEGVELARTMVAIWKKNRFDKYRIVKEAIKGKDGEDVWLLDGKITLVNVTPIRSKGEVLGVMIMGNVIDEDLVKQERQITSGDFAYFSKNRILASSLSSVHQVDLNRFIRQNSSAIAQVLLSKKYYDKHIQLGDKEYSVILAPLASSDGEGLAGFMILRSVTDWQRAFIGSRNFLSIFTILLVLGGVGLALVIVQKAYDSIDFVLEGAHQIIVGNKDYQFTSDDEYLNQFGQTLNMMIAILLGKYIPEDEEEDGAMSFKGFLDSGKAGLSPADKMLIETMDETAEALHEEDREARATELGSESYYDELFNEFIDTKKKIGDDVSQITKERMILKLKRAEQKLIEKHGCKQVHFVVKVENGKVSIKPSPVWK